ncbi:glycosyltransferase [Aquihabitans daechungensis]|uniref:glycosyltransferase n=1 Tax=Aquihabitans daechungensis TaxID=1052257 RepID=UPI003BA0EBFA
MGRRRTEVLRALTTPRSAAAAPGDHRLSVIVPAFGEAGGIGAAIERIRTELAAVAADGGLEVVVVDDGSGDGTAAAARAAGADQVLEFPENRGKGAAVRAGMLAATGRTLVFTDADLSYAPAQIERLLAAVESGWDVVVGNRHHAGSTTIVAAGVLRQVGGRVINLATRAVLVGPHQDTQCGLKAFRSDVARVIFGHSRIDGFAFDIEVIHLVERYGLSLREVEVEVVNSDRSTVHVARDAVTLLGDLARIRRWSAKGEYDLRPAEQDALGLGHLQRGE